MTITQHGSMFDMRINPMYQVDWMNEATGKRFSATKRRVCFRFGFSNADAIKAGETGPACRGEEHEVLLIWSIISGKRLVTMDGNEVHFSCGGRFTENKFETIWTMKGGHTLKLIAHASPPIVSTPAFRQFDLLLDGYSFFNFTKIYELGAKNQHQGAIVSSNSNETYRNYALPARQQPSSTQRPSLDECRVSNSDPCLPVHASNFSPRTHHSMLALTVEANEVGDLLDCGSTPIISTRTHDTAPSQAPAATLPSFNANSIQPLHARAPTNLTYTPGMLALANVPHMNVYPPGPQSYGCYYAVPTESVSPLSRISPQQQAISQHRRPI